MYTNQKRDNIRKYYHIIFLIVQELIPQKITFQRFIIKGSLALILYREGWWGGFTWVRLGWEYDAQGSQLGPCTRISRSRDIFNTSFKSSARAHLSDACCVCLK